MLIEVKNLSKMIRGTFKQLIIYFSVKKGEIFGFPGLNRAGKTTDENVNRA